MSTPTIEKSLRELQTGDRLSRDEFERRYAAMPHVNKAELVEGIVFMPSPVNASDHGGPHFDTITWLGHYRVRTPGVIGADNSSLRLDLDNEPQPDALLMVLPSHGGQARVGESGYVEGAPELVAEVAASSASYDLHLKLNVYRRNGVREYIVWRVLDRQVDWFRLREGSYEPLPRSDDGVYRSEVFPGLWLDPTALIAGDIAGVVDTLERGLATAEHAAFVEGLSNAAAMPRPGAVRDGSQD